MRVRFDDSLKTVLAADTSTAFGARAAYRQLVDLAARRRVESDAELLERVAALRADVPVETRAAVARGVALADPPAALVALLADDVPDVSSAVLRAARLDPEGWEWVLPRLGPHGRSVLRRRTDLPPTAMRALESFGSTDFALGHEAAAAAVVVAPADAPAAPILTPSQEDSFTALGALAAALPVLEQSPGPQPAAERFEIAELVDRIAAFQRDRAAPVVTEEPGAPVASFRFETDATGTIRWVDSAPRGAVVGLSLDHVAPNANGIAPCVDGVAAGAFRKRASFSDARLIVAGASPLAGDWRISAVPLFDPARGHFVGYRGRARRPHIEEDAARLRPRGDARAVEGLRRLVHELRTPANAISGFSELIDQQLLGPVPPAYRDRAATIHRQAGGLIGAIEDLDTAARLEGGALDLREEVVEIAPLLAHVAAELAPLAARRSAHLALGEAEDLAWVADVPATQRLVSRLVASLLAAASPGEVLSLYASQASGGVVQLAIAMPRALAERSERDLLALDDERAGDDDGAPLLGVGFAMRLARSLAVELGGRMGFERDRLTLTLPAASTPAMGQASTRAP